MNEGKNIQGKIGLTIETVTAYFSSRRTLLEGRKDMTQKNMDKEIQQISIMHNELQQLSAPFYQVSFNENEILINESKERPKIDNGTPNCTGNKCSLL